MFNDLIESRRSIRKFRPQPIETKKIDLVVEAALRAPSSRSLNPWEFIVVTEQTLLKQLARAKQHGASFLAGAPLGIVVCADPARCDVWVEDCSIASIFIHMAAHDLGLGSCWIQIRERMHDDTTSSEGYVRQLLAIPDNLRVESIVAIGYADETKPPHTAGELELGKVHRNMYGHPFST